MKFIFDFDDVLFHNTRQFREHMYECLRKAGVSRDAVNEYYKKVGGVEFDLKKLLNFFLISESLYEETMAENKNFINKDLLDLINKVGKENCYIVTQGKRDWQLDKIKKAGIASMFSEIITTQDSKKEAVEKIAEKYKDEEVIFIDDKAKHFEDLDFKKYPNLKTILYDENGLEKIRAILSS